MKHKKMPDKEFAKRMRTLMSNRNVRLVDIARHTDNAVSTVSTWRRGRIPRKRESIAALAESLSVSPEYLLSGKCEKGEIIFSNEKDSEILNHDNTKQDIMHHVSLLIKMREDERGGLKKLLKKLREKFPIQ